MAALLKHERVEAVSIHRLKLEARMSRDERTSERMLIIEVAHDKLRYENGAKQLCKKRSLAANSAPAWYESCGKTGAEASHHLRILSLHDMLLL